MQVHSIYGIDYTSPGYPEKNTIKGHNLLYSQQKWVREPIPDSFDDIDFDDDGNAILSDEQEEYVNSELDRIKHGHYFFNKGELTYITGVNYLYLQYYTLEDGTAPEYRDVDRKWFYFLEYCYNRPYINGIIRIKKRREGASSQAACFLLWIALTNPQSNCGIVSDGGKNAKKVFKTMIVKAFNGFPAFLQPRVEDPDPETKLVFAKPKSKKRQKKTKGQLYNKDRGLQSEINWENTTLNAYDSGRVSAVLIDEAGKWEVDVPINQYWPIVKKTLVQGIKRVGFALMISTVNDAENGGSAYKKVWDDSDHFNNKITGTGLYRYFSPAYDGFPGFIDEWGFSITENASAEMRKMLLETYGKEYDGAIDYLKQQRDNMKDETARSEEVRMNPFNEKEAFSISQAKSHFNVTNIANQQEECNKNPKYLRRGKFYQKEDKTCDWMDTKDGDWLVLKFPTDEERNRRHMTDKGWAPANTAKYCNGIDPHRHSHTKGKKDLSMTAAWIGERLDSKDPDNTGMPVAFYLGRPKEKDHMYDQMLYACIFYGTRVHFETDAGDDYYGYYKKKELSNYIRWTPTCAVDPLSKGKRVPGTSSKDPFALSKQLELGIAYFEHHSHKVWFPILLDEAPEYDHAERQIYDTTVSFLIMLVDMMGDTRATQIQETVIEKPLIATYNLIARNS